MPEVQVGESRNHYVGRCVQHGMDVEGLTQKQALGKCEGMYSEYQKRSQKMKKSLPFGIKFVILNKSKGNRYQNADGTFKNGFDGCVEYMKSKGKSDKEARGICGNIAREKGK